MAGLQSPKWSSPSLYRRSPAALRSTLEAAFGSQATPFTGALSFEIIWWPCVIIIIIIVIVIIVIVVTVIASVIVIPTVIFVIVICGPCNFSIEITFCPVYISIVNLNLIHFMISTKATGLFPFSSRSYLLSRYLLNVEHQLIPCVLTDESLQFRSSVHSRSQN